jgi:hypothetical protein
MSCARTCSCAICSPPTSILKTIRELMNPPEPKRRGIGFTADFDEK